MLASHLESHSAFYGRIRFRRALSTSQVVDVDGVCSLPTNLREAVKKRSIAIEYFLCATGYANVHVPRSKLITDESLPDPYGRFQKSDNAAVRR